MRTFPLAWLSRWTLFPICLFAGASPHVGAQTIPPLTLSDALKTALEENPQVQIQQEQVNVQRGILRQMSGQFDLNLSADGSESRTYQPLTGYDAFLYTQYDGYFRNSGVTHSSQLSLSANKQLRNGIELNPTIQASRVTDNLTNRIGYASGGIHFNVIVPLLRGFGHQVVTANETAAARQVDAAVLNADQNVANIFAGVAASYWSVIAAAKAVDLMRQARNRSDDLLSAAQSLIDADRMPRSDLNQMQADQAMRQSDLQSAEQQLLDAREQLVLQMGVAANEASTLGAVEGELPTVLSPEQIPSDPDAVKRYIDYALQQQPDLQALKKQTEASQVLQKAAQDGLRQQLNVQVSTGVTGLAEGTGFDEFLLSPGHSGRGFDISAGFTYRFPPARDVAGGALQQATAAAHQSDLQYQSLARQVAVNVRTALINLRSASLRARSMEVALQHSQQALDAGQERLRAGVGSTIDVITLEDRLNAALQSDLQAKLVFAQALVQLRLATDTIVAPSGQGGTVDAVVFTTLPVVPVSREENQP